MARSKPVPDPATFTSFGALLRYLRRRQRMTQIELAIAVGYSTAQISRLEQSQRLPNPSTIAALFVPGLGLEEMPDLAARLLELARAAHSEDIVDAPERAPALADGAPLGVPAATEHVLLTKLYLPHARPQRVARPRLHARLDAALKVPLTLVSAPAGWGKTT